MLGSDGIKMDLIKCAPNSLLERVLAIMNLCWKFGHILNEWYVVCIYKSGERIDCQNYHVISLLSTCNSLYAKLLTKWLSLQNQSYQILSMDLQRAYFFRLYFCNIPAYTKAKRFQVAHIFCICWLQKGVRWSRNLYGRSWIQKAYHIIL